MRINEHSAAKTTFVFNNKLIIMKRKKIYFPPAVRTGVSEEQSPVPPLPYPHTDTR